MRLQPKTAWFVMIAISSSLCTHVGCGGEDSTSGGAVIERSDGSVIDSASSSSDAKTTDAAKEPFDAAPLSDSGSQVDASTDVDATLLAPTFDTINLRDGGGLTLNWVNNQPDCDGIEAQRKDAVHPYALIVTTPGSATTTDDPTATANLAYTYDLRCKKGGSYSPYSNELARNPQN